MESQDRRKLWEKILDGEGSKTRMPTESDVIQYNDSGLKEGIKRRGSGRDQIRRRKVESIGICG